MCLLQHNASTTIKNDEGRRASQVACDERIKNVLEGCVAVLCCARKLC